MIEAWWCPECRRAFAGGLGSACISQHPIEPCVVFPGLTPAAWDELMALVRAVEIQREAKWDTKEFEDAVVDSENAVHDLDPAVLAAAREGR